MWWSALALIHVAPLIATIRTLLARWPGSSPNGTDTAPGSLLPLVLSFLAVLGVFTFFVLKLIDVAWLRWRWGRGGIVAFVLALALAHGEHAPDGAGRVMLAEFPGAVAMSALWEATRSRRLLPRAVRRLVAACRGMTLATCAQPGRASDTPMLCCMGTPLARPQIPRAPPG